MREIFFRATAFAASCLVAAVLWNGATAATTLRIGGTGSGLAAMRAIGESLAADDPDFHAEVLPSMGTTGGLQALKEGAIGLAIAARRLTQEERARGLVEGACVNTAMVFVSSRAAAPGIARAELPRLYSDLRPTWPDGSPMKVILRSRTGSETPYLAAAVPGLGEAFEKAYKQPALPVGATDQENVDLAQKIDGSLAIATLLQIRAERLGLHVLTLDGIAPTAATIADKTYPFILPLCAIVPASPQRAASLFVAHLKSPAGQALLRAFDTAAAD